MMNDSIILALFVSVAASALRLSTPLLFASLGGYYSERSGVVNIALEGFMLIGAFGAAAGAHAFAHPGAGLFFGVLAAMGLSCVHAFLCINAKADAIISGIAINFLALGIPPVIAQSIYGYSGGTPQLPVGARIPDTAFGSPLLWCAFLAVGITVYIHRSTRFGQYIRFAGEHPAALESQGVKVSVVRWKGVLLSGFFCGLGGAYLSIDHGTAFSRNMTAGRGFIALAALIVGRHNPMGAALAAMAFGLIEAVQILAQGAWSGLPVQALQALPYAATVVVLAFGLKPIQNKY